MEIPLQRLLRERHIRFILEQRVQLLIYDCLIAAVPLIQALLHLIILQLKKLMGIRDCLLLDQNLIQLKQH